MQSFLHGMIEYAHQISLKWHVSLGFIMGAGPFSYFLDRWEDVLFAFIIGFISAASAGIAKMMIENYFKRRRRQKREAKHNKLNKGAS